MGWTVEILTRERAAPYARLWDRASWALAQQSLEWADAIAPLGPDTPYFLLAREAGTRGRKEAGLPLFLFRGPLGGILTSVPQAGPLGGVLLDRGLESGAAQGAYGALIEAAFDLGRREGCSALTVITHPFADDRALYAAVKPADYVLNNFCQAVEVEKAFGPDGLVQGDKTKHSSDLRRNLKKAAQAGVEVSWSNPDEFDEWHAIHVARHAELGAKPLPVALLRDGLRETAAAGRGALAIARAGGKLLGGCLFIWAHKVGDAFIMSTSAESQGTGTNYALTEFALRQFKARGIRWFNWQSSRRDSGVYSFKERWGSKKIPYDFLTWKLPGFDQFLSVDPREVSQGYPWHYVAPFEALEKRLPSGIFEKC